MQNDLEFNTDPSEFTLRATLEADEEIEETFTKRPNCSLGSIINEIVDKMQKRNGTQNGSPGNTGFNPCRISLTN